MVVYAVHRYSGFFPNFRDKNLDTSICFSFNANFSHKLADNFDHGIRVSVVPRLLLNIS